MLRPLCARWAYGLGTYAHAERVCQELMRMLTIRISSLRTCSACTSVFLFSNVHFVYPQHALKELMRALSMRGRNWSVCWAYMSVTDVCAEHMSHELVHTLSIRVHRAQTCWAYASGTDAYPKQWVRNWCVCLAYASGTDAYHEHTHQFLTRVLSISVKIPILKRSLQIMLFMLVRNWCVHWAYLLGTDARTERTHQELIRTLSVRFRNKWCLAPPKIKATSLYFSPKVTNLERLYGVKNHENPRDRKLTLGHH